MQAWWVLEAKQSHAEEDPSGGQFQPYLMSYTKELGPSQAGRVSGRKGRVSAALDAAGGGVAGGPGTHLALHEHGHVHEHVMQLPRMLFSAMISLWRVSISLQGLLRDAGVHDDLGSTSRGLGPGDTSKREGGGQDSRGQGQKGLSRIFWKQDLLEGFVLSHSPPHVLLGSHHCCWLVTRRRV